MITLTENAIKEVKSAMADNGMEGHYLRVSITSGGCSDYSYKLEFTDKIEEDDDIKEFDEIKVLVDPKSDLYLNETIIDYYTGIEARGFIFNNPSAKGCCSCNQSFRV